MGEATPLAAYLRDLQDRNHNTRLKAALGLVALGDLRALDPLIDALCAEQDVFVQDTVTRALVGLGAPAVAPLIERLGDADARIRHHAAHTLGKIGDARACDPLVARLQDQDLKVVQKAALALGQIGDPRAIPALVPMLGHDARDVQSTVVDVLERFGRAAVAPLLAALAHERWQIQEQAAFVLGFIRDGQAVPALTGLLGHRQWQVRLAALNALGDLGAAGASDRIAAMRDDPDERVRSLAVRVSARLGRRSRKD